MFVLNAGAGATREDVPAMVQQAATETLSEGKVAVGLHAAALKMLSEANALELFLSTARTVGT